MSPKYTTNFEHVPSTWHKLYIPQQKAVQRLFISFGIYADNLLHC